MSLHIDQNDVYSDEHRELKGMTTMESHLKRLEDQLGLDSKMINDPSVKIATARSGLSGELVKNAVILTGDKGTWVRILSQDPSNFSRIYNRKLLSADQSEKILDAIEIYSKAYSLWEKELANEWLKTPNPALNGEPPVNLFDTFEGRKLVKQILAAIEFGEFS